MLVHLNISGDTLGWMAGATIHPHPLKGLKNYAFLAVKLLCVKYFKTET